MSCIPLISPYWLVSLSSCDFISIFDASIPISPIIMCGYSWKKNFNKRNPTATLPFPASLSPSPSPSPCKRRTSSPVSMGISHVSRRDTSVVWKAVCGLLLMKSCQRSGLHQEWELAWLVKNGLEVLHKWFSYMGVWIKQGTKLDPHIWSLELSRPC